MMQQEFIDQADESPRSLLKAGQEDLYLALVFGFQLEMGSCFLIHQALYRCCSLQLILHKEIRFHNEGGEENPDAAHDTKNEYFFIERERWIMWNLAEAWKHTGLF